MTYVLVLILLVLLGVLAFICRIAGDLRSIHDELIRSRDVLERIASERSSMARSLAVFDHSSNPPPHALLHGQGYFVIWEWRQGQWQLVRKSLPTGVEPPAAPKEPGKFEGDHRKIWVPTSQ